MKYVKKSSTGSKALETAAFNKGRNYGYVYRTIEEQIESFAIQEGGPDSLYQTTLWMAEGLRSKAEEIRQQLGNPKLVREVRKDGSATGEGGGHDSEAIPQEGVHVAARGHRTLSKEARAAISAAQTKRWAKFHAQKEKKREKWRRNKQTSRVNRASTTLTSKGEVRKRELTEKQLAAMRSNAGKARAALAKKQKAA